MTGNQLDELFGQQKQPQDLERAFLSINVINYKMTDLAQLIERLIPSGQRRDLAFQKLIELKTALDSAAIHEPAIEPTNL